MIKPTGIAEKCKCGRCIKHPSEPDWVIRGLNGKPGYFSWHEGHCPHCGDGLAIENVSGKGLVDEMVRASRFARLKDKAWFFIVRAYNMAKSRDAFADSTSDWASIEDEWAKAISIIEAANVPDSD